MIEGHLKPYAIHTSDKPSSELAIGDMASNSMVSNLDVTSDIENYAKRTVLKLSQSITHLYVLFMIDFKTGY